MGRQFVVFVDPDFLVGPAAAAGAATAGAMPPRASAMEGRRQVLEQLGNELTGGVAAGAGMAAASVAASYGQHRAVVAMSRGTAPVPGTSRCQVLEGVGALVVDEDDVDIGSLQGLVGITVVADQAFHEPLVTAAVAAAVPDWHLTTTGARTLPGTGRNVLVGVLDTGIDAGHPEFAGKTIHFQEFDSLGRKLGTPARDAGSHGTHVCGLVAGKTCGVAEDADLAVAAVLTLPDAFGRLSGGLVQIANGLNWLLTTQFRPGIPGVDIINASLAGRGFNPFLQSAARSALAAPGVLIVAAIGNNAAPHPLDADQHGSPGNYADVLGVGATDVADRVAPFSDYGTVGAPAFGAPFTKPDLCAPGVQVRSSVPAGFGVLDGTSMASPIVCGFGARMLSAQPALVGQPAALRTALLAKATVPVTMGMNKNLGGAGRIQA